MQLTLAFSRCIIQKDTPMSLTDSPMTTDLFGRPTGVSILCIVSAIFLRDRADWRKWISESGDREPLRSGAKFRTDSENWHVYTTQDKDVQKLCAYGLRYTRFTATPTNCAAYL